MAACTMFVFLFCLAVILPNLPCKTGAEPEPRRPFWRRPTKQPKPTLLPPESKNPEFYRKLREEIPPKNETAKKVVRKLFRFGRKRSVGLEDLVIVLDGSGSVGSCEFGNSKKAMKNMLEYEEPNVDKKFAMVTFATGARKDFDFLEQAIAKDRIDNVPYPGGGTNTQAGLQMAFDIFSKGSRGFQSTKIALLFTDGESNIEEAKTLPNAEKLKKAGVQILVVAVGDRHMHGINEMAHIASYPPAENLFRVEKAGDFFDVVNLAIKEVDQGKYQIINKYKSECKQRG